MGSKLKRRMKWFDAYPAFVGSKYEIDGEVNQLDCKPNAVDGHHQSTVWMDYW